MTLSGLRCLLTLKLLFIRLNPSFSGWPSLGFDLKYVKLFPQDVLIPLLVDDPLWVDAYWWKQKVVFVLIPLLVDDPLRAYSKRSYC